jgi:hypothetical protein
MSSEKHQKTQPQGIDPKTGKPYEPVDIRIPRRGLFDALIKKATQPRKK